MTKENKKAMEAIKKELVKNGFTLNIKKEYQNKSKTLKVKFSDNDVSIFQFVNKIWSKILFNPVIKFNLKAIKAIVKNANKLEIERLKNKNEKPATKEIKKADKKDETTKNIKELAKIKPATKEIKKDDAVKRTLKNKAGKKFVVKNGIDKNGKSVFIWNNKFYSTLKEIKELIEKPVKEIGKTDQLKKRVLELALKSKFSRLDLGKIIKKEFASYKDSTLGTYISDSFNKKYYQKTGIGTLLKYKVVNSKKVVTKA